MSCLRNIWECKMLYNKRWASLLIYFTLIGLVILILVFQCKDQSTDLSQANITVFWVFHILISILFLILHYKDPGFLPFDKIKQNNINNEESQSSKQRDPKPNDQNIFLANKFNVRRLEGSNLSEFNEKIMKKTLDVSIANEENNHQIKNKVEDEDSNEILEVIELNNIADDKNDGDNAILDYKIPKTLKKEDLGSRNIITFGDKKEISIRNLKENDSSFQNEKNNEIESIAIEIRGKNKDIDKNKSFKSITNKDNNSFSISPPEISSNEEEFDSKMIKIGELTTKFCILSQDESYLQVNNNNNHEIKSEDPFPISKAINPSTNPPSTNHIMAPNRNFLPLKLSFPTKIEPHRPPTDTNPPISADSKPNTSRLKASANESIEGKGIAEGKISTYEKNTTALTVSKKNYSEAIINNNVDFFVEKRYCTKCNLEQPLRCKHCIFCNRCVGTYDHHCAWIGSCVGEKNKLIFYIFCWCQLIEIIWVFAKTLYCMTNGKEDGNWAGENWGNVLTIVLSTFFLLMTLNLVIYHKVSLGEHLSWKKITYLKDIPRNFGSPFDIGCWKNLNILFKGVYLHQPFDWKFAKIPKAN